MLPAALALVIGLAGAAFVGDTWFGDRLAHAIVASPRADTFVMIRGAAHGRPIPGGFVGLSLEYPAVAAYAGSDPAAINPVLAQLIRNLAPGQSAVLRIGGDSTDRTWWPVSHAARPRGVTYSLSRRWLAITNALASAVGARLILGINLEANQTAVVVAEARALLTGIGRRWVQALEIGNEPNLYSTLPLYHPRQGHPVFGRPSTYDLQAFIEQFSRLRRLLPAVPLAGPTVGNYTWLIHLRRLLAAEPTLRVVTFHRYPLNRCFTVPGSPDYPTLANLLSPLASRGLTQGLAPYVATAHEHRAAFRIDELNSVACGGKSGVSNTFASALWALDALFASARTGADGVNIHTFPGAAYGLFTFRRVGSEWSASVRPEYYGLLMFAQAAPPGSRLLPVATTGSSAVRGWATRASDGRTRVVLINDDIFHRHVVLIRPSARAGLATLERLTAPSAHATRGVTLDGQSFGVATRTGTLQGVRRTSSIPASAGDYEVTLPAASAAMLTIAAGAL
jgi:hypothetical protein